MNASAEEFRRTAGAAVLAAALGLAAAGCGGSPASTTGAASPAGTSPSAGGSATVSATSPPVLDGATLNRMLLPASAMPAGFRLDADGARNSGPSVVPDSASPVAAATVCNLLTGTSWILAAGQDSASFAQNDYVDAAKTQEVAQEIDAFTGTDAQQVMSTLWQDFGRCRTFTQSYNSMTVHTTLVRSRLTGVADGAIKAVQTSPTFYGGTTLVAIRVGNAIVTCLDSSAHSGKGAAAVTLANRIANELKQAGTLSWTRTSATRR